jgi:hypothetical protein
LSGTVVAKPPPRKSATAAASAVQNAGDVARNAATNAVANSGRNATSTGSAVSTSKETMVPLSAFSRFGAGHTPIAVYHDDLFAASTISFNLAPAYRSAKRRRRSTTGWPGSACLLRSTALSRGRPRRFSNRSHINPCCAMNGVARHGVHCHRHHTD